MKIIGSIKKEQEFDLDTLMDLPDEAFVDENKQPEPEPEKPVQEDKNIYGLLFAEGKTLKYLPGYPGDTQPRHVRPRRVPQGPSTRLKGEQVSPILQSGEVR